MPVTVTTLSQRKETKTRDRCSQVFNSTRRNEKKLKQRPGSLNSPQSPQCRNEKKLKQEAEGQEEGPRRLRRNEKKLKLRPRQVQQGEAHGRNEKKLKQTRSAS